jgi:hypothetical protein
MVTPEVTNITKNVSDLVMQCELGRLTDGKKEYNCLSSHLPLQGSLLYLD